MGLGLPVAMHSRMAFWCSDTEMFCGPAMMCGLWGSWGLGAAGGEQEWTFRKGSLEVTV